MKKTTFRILLLTLLTSTLGWGQSVGSVIVSGSVTDSASGNPLPNWPVYITDSVGAISGLGIISWTDVNGNYLDTLHLNDSAGLVFVFADDTCSLNYITPPIGVFVFFWT